jgi:hypothetical protein
MNTSTQWQTSPRLGAFALSPFGEMFEAFARLPRRRAEVRRPPRWPRSWANVCLF